MDADYKREPAILTGHNAKEKLKVKLYKSPEKTRWLGWIENRKNEVVAFIRLTGELVWEW